MITPTTEFDLDQFCSDDRDDLQKPFRIGAHTYATDGHILVRVPRRPGDQSCKPPPIPLKTIEGMLASHSEVSSFAAPLLIDLPPRPPIELECPDCDGTGCQHDCPDCSCACHRCRGEGTVDPDDLISVSLNGVPFALRYVRLLLDLPGIEIASTQPRNPLPFRFAHGGIGVLMPLGRKRLRHIRPECHQTLAEGPGSTDGAGAAC